MRRAVQPQLIAIICMTLSMAGVRAHAQGTSATLSGTVTDDTGARIPGVIITVVNTATAAHRETTSGQEGQFTIPLLPPGRYTLRARLDGFGPIQMDNIVLNVNDQIALDIRLNVAPVGEQITVVAEPSRTSTSPAVATVIDRQFVQNLPMNGRTFQTLIALTPGVVVTATTPQNPGQFSVNGQRTATNQFTVDGASANFGVTTNSANGNGFAGALPALTASGGTNGLVSIEALEEFRVQTSSYAAEFGRTPGAQIQMVTRSGGNRLSGSAFEYFRDDALDANDWFAAANGIAKAPLSQHNFGGAGGGPLRRDRSFFFGSYEGLRLMQPQTATGVVPSMRLRESAPPAVRRLLDGFPRPTGPDLVNPLTGQATGMAEFASSHSDRVHLDAFSVRVDHHLPGSIVFGRYNQSPSSSTIRQGASSYLIKGTQDLRTATIGLNTTLGRYGSNEFRLNYSRQTAASISYVDTHGGAVVPSNDTVFPGYANPATDVVGIQVGPADSRARYFTGPIANNQQRQFQIVNSMAIPWRAHSLKFGLDYRHSRPTRAPSQLSISMVFGTADAVTSGMLTSFNSTLAFPSEPTFRNLSLFAQDSWAVTSRLTIDYGLRWDFNPPASVPDGQEALTIVGLEWPETYALAPRGTAIVNTRYGDIAPRAGFSHRLRNGPHATVVRGGGGLFYDLGSGETTRAFSGYPFNAEINSASAPYPLQGATAAPPLLPSALVAPYNGSFTVFDPGFQTPRTWQWNFAIAQHLGSSSELSVSYVGAHGERLLRQETRSRPNANFGSFVTVIRSDATSDYRALQLQFSRRLSRGVQAHAAYTWSRAIDEVSDTLTNVRLRGPADFDLPHVFGAGFTMMLPQPAARIAAAVFGGWSLNGIGRWQSGPPVNVAAATSTTIDGVTVVQRPNLLPGIDLYLDDPKAPGGRVFNATVDPSRPGCAGPFCRPAAGVQGDFGRNQLRGFNAAQVDLSLRRTLAVTTQARFSIGVEAFNVFNRANFGPPVGSLTSGQFGRPTAMLGRSLGGLSPVYQIGGPRSMQLTMRADF